MWIYQKYQVSLFYAKIQDFFPWASYLTSLKHFPTLKEREIPNSGHSDMNTIFEWKQKTSSGTISSLKNLQKLYSKMTKLKVSQGLPCD